MTPARNAASKHWLEVYWLVEEEYTLAKIADAEGAG